MATLPANLLKPDAPQTLPQEALVHHIVLGRLDAPADLDADGKFDIKEARSSIEDLARDVEKASIDLPEATFVQQSEDFYRISLDNSFHPTKWGALKRWSILSTYCLLQSAVMLEGVIFIGLQPRIAERWPASPQILTFGVSGFLIGTAVGPLFIGPASDRLGRKYFYLVSIFLWTINSFGIAFARNLPMLIIFMTLSGIAASPALSLTAATASDLFGDAPSADQAMALFVLSANFGPSLGAPVGQALAENDDLGFKWLGLLNVILGAAFCLVLGFIPETLPSIVIRRAALAARIEEPIQAEDKSSVARETLETLKHAAKIMVTEPLVPALAFVNGFSFGLILLQLDSLFETFVQNKHLSMMQANWTFMNVSVGCLFMFVFLVPIQTRLTVIDRAKVGIRPEARFLLSLWLVWLFPVSLFWFAWTSGPNAISYWSPIAAGVLLGAVNPLVWVSIMCYTTDCFPDCAGAAVVALLVPSFLLAAFCAHFGIFLLGETTTEIASSILGGLSIIVCALVLGLYFGGPKLRARSHYAKKF